jgi:phosphate uptake regulator
MLLELRLDNLRRALDELSITVDDNLRTVLHQLTCDDASAGMPLKSIDALGRAARENCMMLMAKEHPFASDLKYAMAALRVEHDYDRIQELLEALHRRIAVLRSSSFKEICQDMTGVMADILEMHELVRRTFRRNLAESDIKLLSAQQEKLNAGIQVSILTIQNRILSSIAGERRDPETIVEVVLACRHLKRIASSLNSMPEEMHTFG